MASIKNLSTPESRDFWAHAERVAREVRENELPWQRQAREAREEFARTHVRVTCTDCNGRGYRSWDGQTGCATCWGAGEWYEVKTDD